MQTEFSAGGVVFKKDGDHLFVLLAKHSSYHSWGFPKGLIGDKDATETKEITAIREVREETGADGKIIHPLTPVTYWFQRKGERVKKTVYYYVMEYQGGDITQHDFEMEEVEWVNADNVVDYLKYDGDKKVWEEAKQVIKRLID